MHSNPSILFVLTPIFFIFKFPTSQPQLQINRDVTPLDMCNSSNSKLPSLYETSGPQSVVELMRTMHQ